MNRKVFCEKYEIFFRTIVISNNSFAETMYEIFVISNSSALCLIFFCDNAVAGSAIWCYRCTSATPGCAEDFHWRGIGYWGDPCPEDNDICVKVTERKGGNTIDKQFFLTRLLLN